MFWKKTIKIFADGANLSEMFAAYESKSVDGFTTNPTLMRKAGILDYETFAREVLAAIPDLPISLEVFADEFDLMYLQALKIAQWGANVSVKVPITNTRGDSAGPLVERLSKEGVRLNVTAVLTLDQVRMVSKCLRPEVHSIVSVFAGRIADTGRDPIPTMVESRQILADCGAELLWASPREVLNIYQAQECGCHIITVTPELLAKLKMAGKDLDELSRETVQMFHNDAVRSGFEL